MPAERLSMRKVREVLRLKHSCGASVRTIARSVGVGHSTVAEYLWRTAVIGITWPVPAEIDDAELERRRRRGFTRRRHGPCLIGTMFMPNCAALA